MRVEKTKKFCCLCCVSGPVNVALSLHAGGGAAVPGDTLLANLDVENNSNVNLLSVSLKFIKAIHLVYWFQLVNEILKISFILVDDVQG